MTSSSFMVQGGDEKVGFTPAGLRKGMTYDNARITAASMLAREHKIRLSDKDLQVITAIVKMEKPWTVEKIRKKTKLSKEEVEQSIQKLRKAKIIKISRNGRITYTPEFDKKFTEVFFFM